MRVQYQWQRFTVAVTEALEAFWLVWVYYDDLIEHKDGIERAIRKSGAMFDKEIGNGPL
jgi:hypothetical protein